jgi:hypothetical protein
MNTPQQAHASSSDIVFGPILQPPQGLTALKIDVPLTVSPEIKVM